MNAFGRYDWQLSDATRGYQLAPDEFEFDMEQRDTISHGVKQEFLSAIAVAGLVLVAYALL